MVPAKKTATSDVHSVFFLLHLECTSDNVHGDSDDVMEQIASEGSRSRNSRLGSCPWLVIFGPSSSDASTLICDDQRGPRSLNRGLESPLLRAPEAIHRPWLILNSRHGLGEWRSCRRLKGAQRGELGGPAIWVRFVLARARNGPSSLLLVELGAESHDLASQRLILGMDLLDLLILAFVLRNGLMVSVFFLG